RISAYNTHVLYQTDAVLEALFSLAGCGGYLVYLFSKRPLSRNEQHEPHAVLFHARLHHPQPRFAEVPSFQEHGAAQSAMLKRGSHLLGFSALASEWCRREEVLLCAFSSSVRRSWSF